jgi:hypothetical protein
MSDIQTARKEITDYCKAMLGDGMVEVELDPIHYKTAIDRALAKYRQRSSNSVEESYCFLTLKLDTNDYILPKEIQQVRQIYRRSIGSRSGGGGGGIHYFCVLSVWLLSLLYYVFLTYNFFYTKKNQFFDFLFCFVFFLFFFASNSIKV